MGEYLKKYQKLNKKTQDRIQAVFDSINIKTNELHKTISNNEKERLKRRISEWQEEGLLTGYFSYLVNSIMKKSRITYNDMLNILLYGIFTEERATLDEYDNILFTSISQELYNQGIDEINPKNKDNLNLTNEMLISFLVMPIDGVIWKDYVQALALTNYQEIKKIAVDNIIQERKNNIDDNIFQKQLQKQRNRLISITDNGISGRLDLQTTVIGNLSYLQAGIDTNVRYVKFVSDLCENVTKMCSNMDGIIFDIKGDNKFHRWYGQDAKSLKYEEIECFGLVLGVNLPPIFHHFHWCHSTLTYQTELSADEIRKLMKNGNIRDEQPIDKFIGKTWSIDEEENFDNSTLQKEDVVILMKKAKEIMGEEFSNKFKGVKISVNGEEHRSFYKRSENKVYLSNNADEYTIIHELGHKYYNDYNLEENKTYQKILKNKFSKYTKDDFEEVKGSKNSYYLLKDSSEFVSKYQTRIYKGNRSSFTVLGKVKERLAKEYLSEGLKYYFKEPNKLYNVDKPLYNFIDKIVKGK